MLWSCTKEDSATISVLSFEGMGTDLLAGPTSYGENLYSAYGEGQITTYHDPATELSFGLAQAPAYDWTTGELLGNKYELFNGGIAASAWNDMQTVGYRNQCSVYYKDPVTGRGGHNGSATFGLVAVESALTFDSGRDAFVESLYVCNATYAALSMKNGDEFAIKHHYANKAWFKVVFTGVNNAEVETGQVQVYLSDFRQLYSPGLLTQWTKVDLSTLGRVQKVLIHFDGSDKATWGLNTPQYVCIDDITVSR